MSRLNELIENNKCVFHLAYSGECETQAANDGDPPLCPDHMSESCANCGDQALGQCPASVTSFVCGMPLCHDCKCPKHDSSCHGSSRDIDTSSNVLDSETDIISETVDKEKSIEERVAYGQVNEKGVKLKVDKEFTSKNQTFWTVILEIDGEENNTITFQKEPKTEQYFNELVSKHQLKEL